MRRATVPFVFAVVVSLLAASSAMAATIVTHNTANPNFAWESTSTWVGGVVPGPSDDVIIGGSASVLVSATTGSVTVNSLTIQGGVSPSEPALLSIQGGVTLTVSTDLQLNNNGATADLTYNDAATVDVNGGIYGNGDITFAAGGGTLRLGGDFSLTGVFDSGGGEVFLDGTAHQTWQPITTFNDLYIQNSSTDIPNTVYDSVRFSNTIEVWGTLYLQGGIVDAQVDIGVDNPISRTSGHIVGYLDHLGTTSTTYTFPVGDYTYYTPVDITFSSSGSITVRSNDYRYYTAGPNSLRRHWEMVGNDAGATAVTFHYNENDITAGDESTFVLGQTDGATWTRYDSVTRDTVNNTISYSGVAFFVDGYWTAGETSSVTTATQLVIKQVNEGLTGSLKQNTPFDVLVEAQDAGGNPATVTNYTTLSLNSSGGTGALTDVNGSVAPLSAAMNGGTIQQTFYDVIYSAADSTSLVLADTSCCTTQLTGDTDGPFSFGAPDAELTVTTTGNYGLGSLRHAIHTSNAGGCTTSPCPINFDIPAEQADGEGIFKIVVTGNTIIIGDQAVRFNPETHTSTRGLEPLPDVINAAIIDGTTQSGYSGEPLIEIENNTNVGISFFGGASTLRGIAIHGGDAVKLAGDGGHTVEACYVGLTATGAIPDGGTRDTTTGIYISIGGNTIGGNSLSQRNVISAANSEGIYIEYADNNQILGNFIGISPSAATGFGNGTGIYIYSGNNNTIGNASGGRNSISGNIGAGIAIYADTISEGTADGNTITGNDVDANGYVGISIDGNTVSDTIIGAMTAGDGNSFVGNTDSAIEMLGDSTTTAIFGNAMSGNGTPVIDLDGDGAVKANDAGDVDTNDGSTTTANNGQNRPEISRAEVFGSDLQVDVTVNSSSVAATQSIRVELFEGSSGQPARYIGGTCFGTTNIVNNFTIFMSSADVVAGDVVLATATSFTSTDCSGNLFSDGTSEVSDAATATACSQPTVTAGNTGPYCEGATIQLQATAIDGATYAWTGPNGFTSSLQNPTLSATIANAGTYSVTATVDNCTSAASSTTVVVNAVPSTAASNTGPYCEGATIQLQATAVTDGIYAWTGPNSFTSSDQNPTLPATTAAAGTYSVTVTKNGCTSASSSTTVVVNTVPSTTASNGGPYCEGATIQLTATTVAGATYAWTGPNSFTSTDQNPTLPATTAAAGTYTVTATVNGCTSAASSTSVVVNVVPSTTASNTGPYCEGATIQLQATTVAGAIYSWTGPNGFSSSDQNPTLPATAATAGTYSVTATANGCTSASSSTTVVVNAVPSTTASNGGPYCEGATIQLNATTVAGATYAWTGPNSFTSTDQNPTLPATAAAAGTYSVTATANGCTSASSSTTVVVNTTPSTTASNSGPFCEGATIQLNATFVAGATYTWTGPNSFNSTAQNPTIPNATAANAGTYTVTATLGSCTSAASSTTVVVNTTPSTTASNTGPYCEGATIQLNATTVAGASYAWTGPNGFTSTDQNPTLPATLAAAGTYSVTATLGSCSSATSSTTVVVNTTPSTTASNGGAYCEGATIQLNATTVAGATYAWTGPNGYTSTDQNPTIANATTANAGVYTVTATANGCTSAASSTTVVVNTTAATTASNTGPYCEGATIQLNATTVAGATYSWTGPNGFTSSQQNPTLSATTAAAGTYTVTAIANGCPSASSSTTVTVNPIPSAPTASNTGPYCEGGTIQLNASTVAGATYEWSGPNGFSSTLQNPTLPATTAAAGFYKVKAIVNGCTSAFSTTTVVVNANPDATITAESAVCAGSTGNVASVASQDGATYAWTVTGGTLTSASNTSSITYTAGASGTVALNVVVTLNGCTGNGAKNVTITGSPALTVTAPSSVDAGQTAVASIATQPQGASIVWTITNATLQSGQGTNEITFTAGSSGSVGISVTSDNNGCVSSGNTSVDIVEPTGADLSVQKDGPSSVLTNASFDYTITISNAGPLATTVQMNDLLPNGVAVTSISANGWSCSSNATTVACSGTLSAGASQTITLTVTAPSQSGVLTNKVEVTSQSTPDPNTSNNTATATTQVTPQVTCATTPPSLNSPANNATVTSPVTFSWSSVTGAVLYELWTTDGAIASLAGTTSSLSFTTPLPSGPSSWYVVAQLGSGCDALVSETRSFTVQPSNNCGGLGAPQITAPSEGATSTSPLTVSWTAVAQAIGYRVWLSDDGAALQDIGSTNGATSLLIAAPTGEITIFVDALFGGCDPQRSAPVHFNVPVPDPCDGRGFATPTAPANNTTLSSSNVDFTWNAAPNADGYRLWVQMTGSAAFVLETTTDTFSKEKLDSGEGTWWVETLYDGCASTESARFTFFIPEKQNCSTAKPELFSPSNNSTTQSTTVTFTWSTVDDAVSYEIWLALNKGTSTLLATVPAGTTSVTKEVPAGDLEWFVRVLVDRCPSRDSQTFAFTVETLDACEDNKRPVALTPADGNEVTSPVDFEFTPVDGASSYDIYVVRGNGAPQLVTNPASLATGAARWFVRANFPGGCPSLDSAEVTFKVVPKPDACASLTPPIISAPGQISAGTEFRINWTPEPAATQYQLQIASDPDFNDADLITTTATAADLSHPTDGILYTRVRAIDTRCTPTATVSAYGPVSAILILPEIGEEEGSADLTKGGTLEYSIFLGPEYAGQTFTATSKDNFLTITPAVGVVPAAGITILVTADTSSLPVGATIGSVVISLSGPTLTSNATTVTTSISINLVTPISPSPKDTPPPDAMIIPAVANAQGINAVFQSDVRVSNTSPQLIKYQLTFVPTGEAGIADGKQTTFSVEPGRTVALDDVLKTWFGSSGTNTVGSLEIRPLTQTSASTSSSAVGALANIVSFASSRTFNNTANGTFGQFIPAVPFANFLGKAAEGALENVLSLQQISQSNQFRTNLGFVEGSGEGAELLVSVFGSNGQLMGSFPVTLNGGQHTQLNLNQQGFNVEDGRVEVQVVSGSGKITAYASVLDNATSDAMLVTPVTLNDTGNTKWVVPGVADVASGFANWKTDLRVFNADDEAVTIKASFHSMNGGEPKVTTFTVQPGEVKNLDKALPTLFNVTGDGGAIHLETVDAARLIATARTYNETSNGSYGLFANAVTPNEAVGVGSRPLQLLQLEESTRYRSNIGFAEVTGKPVTLEVTMIPPDSKFAATIELQLGPNEFRQIGSMLQTLGVGDVHNARISVRAIDGEGRATAYAAVMDMKTNDPMMVPAQ